MKFKLRYITSLAAIVSGLGVDTLAATRNVPTAYPTIQSAVAASVAGDIVDVEPGLYRETVSFQGKRITIRSTQGPEVTIIQPLNPASTVVTFLSGEPSTATLEGFTIRGGAIGIQLATTVPTIRNNIIMQNQLGMYLYFASPNVRGNTISSNSPNGGIYIQGSSTPQIIGNNISFNHDTSTGGGAAIEMFGAGRPTIRNNLISYNTAPSGGGGTITMVNISDALIEQNLIVRNEAGNNGTIAWLASSGASGARVINNTIAFNNSTLASGIAADGFDSTAEIINNIIYASGSQTGILVGGFDPNLPLIRTNLVFSESGSRYAGIAADQTGLNGNISGDPLFLSVPQNDFHLRFGSPAIDIALASRAPASDFAGLARPVDGNGDGNAAPDLGVYEFPGGNHPPVVDPKALEVAEDSSGVVQLSGSDEDGDPLTFQIISNPAHGTLLVNGQNVTYTPNANYNGADSFRYIANDSEEDSTPATVSVTVTSVNDTPVATGAAVTTAEDTARLITLVAHDLDNDPLIYTIAASPQHGTLSGSGPNVTYTPEANFNGTDSFEFFVQDPNSGVSAPAAISITVTGVNDAPAVNPLALRLLEDSSVAVGLSGSDVDGDALTFRVVTQPANGTLSFVNNQLIYTPNPNFHGADEFTYVASDGTVDSASAAVALTIQAVNDIPAANSQAYSTQEDQPFTLTLTGSDIEGDVLTHRITRRPLHGSLAVDGNTIHFRPEPNFNGADSLEFVMSDGQSDSAVARIDVTITPVNDGPVASNGAFSGAEDASVPIAVTASDTDGDALVFVVVNPPQHGTLSGAGPGFTYQPAANFNGDDSFAYKVNDGSADSDVATVLLTIAPVNDAPTAVGQTVSLAQNQPRTIVVTGTDVDGDSLTYSIKQPPVHGTLSGTAPNFVYTPAPNYSGQDSFQFFVHDGTFSSTGTVSITVDSHNQAPVAQPKSIALLEDTTESLILKATDPDGNALSYSIMTAPAHGTLSGTLPKLVYTPAANFFGTDSFTFRASDGIATSEPAIVTITVKPVNDAPTFTLASNSVKVPKGAGLQTYPAFIQNLSAGPNEANQTVSLFIISNSNEDLFKSQPAITADGKLTFRPRPGRTGSASITVKAKDDGGTARNGIDRSTQRFTIVVGTR